MKTRKNGRKMTSKQERFSVSNVKSMDTLRENVLQGIKEDNFTPLMMLIQSHLREMKT
jgi:hypothetical protein